MALAPKAITRACGQKFALEETPKLDQGSAWPFDSLPDSALKNLRGRAWLVRRALKGHIYNANENWSLESVTIGVYNLELGSPEKALLNVFGRPDPSRPSSSVPTFSATIEKHIIKLKLDPLRSSGFRTEAACCVDEFFDWCVIGASGHQVR